LWQCCRALCFSDCCAHALCAPEDEAGREGEAFEAALLHALSLPMRHAC
jgi:hypothetical protein